jgi:hypothetical protein
MEDVKNGAIIEGNLKSIRLTSNINGNSIFIPAAGYCNGSLLYNIGMNGGLWSSSLVDGNDVYARNLYFSYYGDVIENGYSRCFGLSVRGVQA